MKKTLIITFILIFIAVWAIYYKNISFRENWNFGDKLDEYAKLLKNYNTDSIDSSAIAWAPAWKSLGFMSQKSVAIWVAWAPAWWFTTQRATSLGVTNNIASSENIAFKVWADQDINLFRENIKNWKIPNKDVLTYNWVFWDYHFDLPKWECKTTFCPLVNMTTWENINWKTEYFVHIGLGSNIKKEDFKRKKTNFIIVIDKSGSMWWSLTDYYYNSNSKCKDGKMFFEWECLTKDNLEKNDIFKDYSKKNKMDISKQAMVDMLDKMQDDDKVAVIIFDNEAKIVHPLVKVKKIKKDIFKNHINQITADGGTNMESAMKELEKLNDDLWEDYQTRVLFLTDAMPNIDETNPYSLWNYVKKMSDKGIYFTFIWIWVDFQQQYIQKLGKYKWTNYFFVNSNYDIYKRLVKEFDYNFFPMLFNLSFKVDNIDNIDKVYWLDNNLEKDWELFHINTLFPTPPTDNGYRGSIILLKLKNKPEKEIKFSVSYEKLDGKKEDVETTVKNEIIDDISAKKWIVLVNYIDTMKKMITEQEPNNKLVAYLEKNKNIFEAEDKKMFEKEIETAQKLVELIKNWEKEQKDYWIEK